MMNRLSLIIIIIISVLQSTAQGEVEMADNFRGEGKIYVVLAVLIVILSGLFYAIFRIERKVKRLEQNIRDRNA